MDIAIISGSIICVYAAIVIAAVRWGSDAGGDVAAWVEPLDGTPWEEAI